MSELRYTGKLLNFTFRPYELASPNTTGCGARRMNTPYTFMEMHRLYKHFARSVSIETSFALFRASLGTFISYHALNYMI